MNIKILRLECTMCPRTYSEPGCSACDHIEEMIKEVVRVLGIDAKIEEIRDTGEIINIGELIGYPMRSCCHFNTPVVVLNEKPVCSGRVPNKAEVTSLISTALEKREKQK